MSLVTCNMVTSNCGIATLSSGTVIVNVPKIDSETLVVLTPQDVGTLNGIVRVSAKVTDTSFTITSSDSGDTAKIGWVLFFGTEA